MQKAKSTIHSLENLKQYHNESIQFFGSELILLKEVIPKIKDERIAKAAVLLVSCGQTGAALLQLANQTEKFTSETVMLARSFMEKVINFCYVCVCDDKEYRAFLLHPIYKYYHSIDTFKIEDGINLLAEKSAERKELQKKLVETPIVKEALEIFSYTKSNLNWTKKNLNQRIEVIEKWGKCIDAFFTLSKFQYYSDASEALHGSLYGCTFDIGVLATSFNQEELEKKVFKDKACILLHLGMLIHESFTVISYSTNIKKFWKYSYNNRNLALNLLFHILELDKKPKVKR